MHTTDAPSGYDALPGLRWSRLRRMWDSPHAYRCPAPPSTASQARGSLLHALVLGTPRVFVHPGTRRGAAWTAAVDAAGPDTLVVPEAEYAEVSSAAGAVLTDERLAEVWATVTDREIAVQWVERGRPAKAQVDALTIGGMIELKSARDCSPRGFAAAAARYRYPGQLAWYRRGLRASGRDPGTIRIVVVEIESCDVGVYRVPTEMLDREDVEIDRMLDTLELCEATGDWPGRCPGEPDLQLPAWADTTRIEIDGVGVEL